MAGYIGNKSSVVSSGAERKFKFAITETTTTLSNLAYTRDLVHVFHNGVRLVDGTDYTATNGTSITLTNAAENGDEVVVISYASFQPSDTVSASTGGVFEGNITVNGDLTVDADTLFVDAATNEVGIGTTTAARSARLTVKAGNSTLGSGYSQLSVITSDAQAADVGGSIVLGGQSTAADWVYGSVSGRSENNSYAGYLAFGTSTSLGAHAERMRIDSSGNVGIGTSSPAQKLDVTGGYALLDGLRIGGGDITNTIYQATGALSLSTGSASGIVFKTNLTDRMVIDASGNVGIGTSSPTVKLHVEGADNLSTRGRFVNSSSGTTLQLGARRDVSFVPYIGSESNHAFAFITNDTERMRIDASGNLLVGKTSYGSVAGIGSQMGAGGVAIFTASSDAPLYLNRTTSDGTIVDLRKDGTTVGSIGSNSSSIYALSGDTGILLYDFADEILPVGTSGGTRDAAISLGRSTTRFKDLYLSGGVYLGGTGAANLLDDYEEGTFTPTATWISGGTINAYYVKVGQLVHFNMYFNGVTVSSVAATRIEDLPFLSNAATSNFSLVVVGHGTAVPNCNSGYVDSTHIDLIENGTTSWAIESVGTKYMMITGTYYTA